MRGLELTEEAHPRVETRPDDVGLTGEKGDGKDERRRESASDGERPDDEAHREQVGVEEDGRVQEDGEQKDGEGGEQDLEYWRY